MTDIVERLRAFEEWLRQPKGAEPFTLTSDVFDEAADEIERLRAAFAEMREDLIYLNKMCMTLMSLLPPETTPEDVREAMKNHGGEVREGE